MNLYITLGFFAWCLTYSHAGFAAGTQGGTNVGEVPNPFDFPAQVDVKNGRLEHVSGGAVVSFYGGHYSVQGPIRQAGYCGYPGKMGVDADGNLYFADLANNQIWAFINGRACVLAGTGARGFRDNCPAGQAFFDIKPYTLHTACAVGSPATGKGAVYVADNDRVRRIQKKEGRWWVDTFAGGGDVPLKIGEKKPATSIKLNTYYHSVAADLSQSNVVLILDYTPRGLVRLTPDGMAEKIEVPKGFEGQGLQTDRQGRLYGWSREHNFTRLDIKTGKLEVLAVDNPPNRAAIKEEMQRKYGAKFEREGGWDGPADKVEWFCPGNYAVDASGAALYAGGGDAWNIRRVKDGYVKTLFADGNYHIRQAVDEKILPIWQFGSAMGSAGDWIYLHAGPYEGNSCIIKYLPGRDIEVEGE